MKNIISKKLIIGLIGISIIAGSCVHGDALLETSDPMNVDEASAWTTEHLTKLGMNGVYAGLKLGKGATGRDTYQFDTYVMTAANSVPALLRGSATSSDGLFLNTWKDMYEGIFRCNDAIVNIPLKGTFSETLKEQYIAEAKFLRAFFYTKLNMLYRGVPIYEETMTVENSTKPRSTEQEVWDLVLEDLNYCLEGDRLPVKYDAGNSDYGHVTRGAAYALRGKVYMWLKEYAKAISDFDAVETCGYSLYQGEYKALFKEVNEQSDEMIFSIQNIDRSGFGSSTQFYLGSRSAKGPGGCWNTYIVHNDFVDIFEKSDGTKFNWDDLIPGYSTMVPAQREVFFLRDIEGIENILRANGFGDGDETKIAAEVAAVKTAVQNRLNTLTAETRALYLPSGNEARIKKAFENRDPRLAATVITPYSEYLGYMDGSGDNIVTMRWPFRSEAVTGFRDLRTDTPSYLYYLNRKWVYEGGNEITNREYGPTDFPLIRLADVILLKAEAYALSDNLSKAMTEVNRIRSRAGMPDITTANTPSKEYLVNRIINERRVELFNEGHSLFDEFRRGTWKQTKFTTPTQGVAHAWGDIVSSYSAPTDDQAKYWPLPASEIQQNSSLTQNTGW